MEKRKEEQGGRMKMEEGGNKEETRREQGLNKEENDASAKTV